MLDSELPLLATLQNTDSARYQLDFKQRTEITCIFSGTTQNFQKLASDRE